ncbi:GIY-YIG nuclease family protein [Rhodococcus ruber]|uniref:GIY-YIG nuclease family protein n=1 Tax=Rhodococcus ruber TaxID=1830 RepID=UPI00177F0AC8|nr:GIY-YIG nuclease family protein [Rhodococcus ruber]MBD8056924.1 GIY-YIG nuclease family protein [Rhodococcus ruber]
MTDDHQVLYRFLGFDGQLLYVGITCDPSSRWPQHSRDKPWWSEVSQVILEHHDSRESVEHAERQAIRTENPRYNKVRFDGGNVDARELARQRAREAKERRKELERRKKEADRVIAYLDDIAALNDDTVVFRAARQLERYPEFADEIEHVVSAESDRRGRPLPILTVDQSVEWGHAFRIRMANELYASGVKKLEIARSVGISVRAISRYINA